MSETGPSIQHCCPHSIQQEVFGKAHCGTGGCCKEAVQSALASAPVTPKLGRQTHCILDNQTVASGIDQLLGKYNNHVLFSVNLPMEQGSLNNTLEHMK